MERSKDKDVIDLIVLHKKINEVLDFMSKEMTYKEKSVIYKKLYDALICTGQHLNSIK